MRSVMSKMATIECSTCATLEIYSQDASGEPNLGWNALDADQCKAPPINRCPHARAEVSGILPTSTDERCVAVATKIVHAPTTWGNPARDNVADCSIWIAAVI